jgi:prepilin-type N-terminal cleavage/methylation domain-containing protein
MKLRTQNSELRTQRSFTLIEMLAVIVIIMILAGMLYPALRSVREGPKKALAKSDCVRIELAIQAYYNEYGKWPPNPASTAEFTALLNGGRNPFDGSAGAAYARNNNSRSNVFMEFDRSRVNSNNEFLDPWGNPYIILIDNGNNCIGGLGATWRDYNGGNSRPNDGILPQRNGGAYTITRPIAVYSFGPNEIDNAAAGQSYDDITNWY